MRGRSMTLALPLLASFLLACVGPMNPGGDPDLAVGAQLAGQNVWLVTDVAAPRSAASASATAPVDPGLTDTPLVRGDSWASDGRDDKRPPPPPCITCPWSGLDFPDELVTATPRPVAPHGAVADSSRDDKRPPPPPCITCPPERPAELAAGEH